MKSYRENRPTLLLVDDEGHLRELLAEMLEMLNYRVVQSGDAAAALDALISSARRDRAEYGRDQLRLVAAFLRWHDVKNDPTTPIESPLVLAPVTLTKQRGVRDAYRLELTSTFAEVNPVSLVITALRDLAAELEKGAPPPACAPEALPGA